MLNKGTEIKEHMRKGKLNEINTLNTKIENELKKKWETER